MSTGLVRQALRRHRGSLAGPAVTHVVAATVVSTMVLAARSVRASLPASQRTAAVAEVLDATGVFVGVAVYLSIVLIGVTMHLAVSGQVRDLALLRAVGASPGQVRGAVVLQALVVGVPASVVGSLLGIPAGALWVGALRAHGVLPPAVRFTIAVWALPIAVGIAVVTSVAGALVAVLRTARLPPGVALTEAATGRRRVRPLRTRLGAGVVIGGVVLSAVLAAFADDQAAGAAFLVMLAECVGVGLLGPVLLHAAARVVGRAAPDGPVRVALDDVDVRSRQLSGALVPLVLAAAFATVKVASHATAAAVHGVPDPRADVWTDLSGTAVYCAFAAVTAVNCFVTVRAGRRRDLAALQLTGASRRTLVGVAGVEAAVVSATALVAAAGVAAATIVPVIHAEVGTWLPRVPAGFVAGCAALVTAVAAAGIVVPTAVLTRQLPIHVVVDPV